MMIDKAARLAAERHAGQFRKGPAGSPYITHCGEVAALVAEHGGTEAAIAAAWLHDTVEDTGTSLAEIEPRTFSFNSPYGACPVCDGLGVVEGTLADGVTAKDVILHIIGVIGTGGGIGHVIEYRGSAIRVAPHVYNDGADIAALLAAL